MNQLEISEMYSFRKMNDSDLNLAYSTDWGDSPPSCIPARSSWPDDLFGANCVVDEKSGALLLDLPGVRLDSANWYLLCFDGGVVVVRNEGYCLFSIKYFSPLLENRLNEVKELLRAMFRSAGLFLDGAGSLDGVFSVPESKFID